MIELFLILVILITFPFLGLGTAGMVFLLAAKGFQRRSKPWPRARPYRNAFGTPSLSDWNKGRKRLT